MSEDSARYGGVTMETVRKRLRDAYPPESLFEGKVITLKEMEHVLNADGECPFHGSQRMAVIYSWRFEMENSHGIVLNRKRNESFEVVST